jgi:hypothetical protein
VTGTDARVFAGLADITDDRRVAGRSIEQRHVHRRRITPQTKQHQAAGRELIDRLPPAFLID